MASFARRERRALCDLALAVGEDAPTLSGDWDVKDLVCHLLVRETSAIGAPGIVVAALSKLTDREMRRLRRQEFDALVERLRSPGLTPYAVPRIEALANTLEFFVHHEDIRRAQPEWRRRSLDAADQDALWGSIGFVGRGLVRGAGVPVAIRRTDTGKTTTLRRGEHPVEVAGPVSEIVLFLFGRDQTRDLAFEGPEERVAQLRRSSRGV
jgi:uncharacterized protein (TIGR03085 family)